MIRLEHVSKTLGSHRVVTDLSCARDEGGITGFLGANGAGKTTTMRLISGFLAPDEGRILVGGRIARGYTYKRDIGYLPENCPLYPDLTVLEYLDMMARLRGIGGAGLRPAVQRMVDACGLAPVLRQPAGQLSKGFRQRVGLAGALIHEPALLILDEPTTGLDPIQIREIRTMLAALGKRRTLLLSSHLLDQVGEICGRILVLDKGRLRYDGPPHLLAADTVAREARLTGDIDPAEVHLLLAEFPFIQEISAPSAQEGFRSYLLRGNFDDRAMSEVFRFLAQKSWRVSHWAPLLASLETRFARLTREDP